MSWKKRTIWEDQYRWVKDNGDNIVIKKSPYEKGHLVFGFIGKKRLRMRKFKTKKQAVAYANKLKHKCG